MSKKSKFPELKQEIKSREAASREIRKKIQATSGLDRHEAWLEKRQEGSTTRCYLLLYAMVRGRPRHSIEPKHSPHDNWWIQSAMGRMAEQHKLAATKEAIEQWLKAAPPTVSPEAEVAA